MSLSQESEGAVLSRGTTVETASPSSASGFVAAGRERGSVDSGGSHDVVVNTNTSTTPPLDPAHLSDSDSASAHSSFNTSTATLLPADSISVSISLDHHSTPSAYSSHSHSIHSHFIHSIHPIHPDPSTPSSHTLSPFLDRQPLLSTHRSRLRSRHRHTDGASSSLLSSCSACDLCCLACVLGVGLGCVGWVVVLLVE